MLFSANPGADRMSIHLVFDIRFSISLFFYFYQFRIIVLHKSGVGWNYRQIADFGKGYEACHLMKNLGEMKEFEFLQKPVEWFNRTLNGAVHTCPYTVIS
jgi:hypothetical protein